MILGPGKGHGQWSSRNRALAETLTLYESSTCDGCGQPVAESFNPETEGHYDVIEVTCVGCRAKEIHQQDNKDPEPGTKLRIRLNPDFKPDPNLLPAE